MKKNTVLVTGNFNVLHTGHIRLLKFAKNFGEKLVVGVFSDAIAKNAVDVPQDLRIEAVSSIDLVHEVKVIDSLLKNSSTSIALT